MKYLFKKPVYYFILSAFAFITLFPLAFVFANSFFASAELKQNYGFLMGDESLKAFSMNLIPKMATLKNYSDILLASPLYLMKFWISLFISLTIMTGQVVLSCFSGYGFAKFDFRFKKLLFFLIIILMMLPHQVTLVPNYIVLEKLKLIGTYHSLIIPGIFSVFGVFLITQVFTTVPTDIIDAAQIDGASHMSILFKVVIPYHKSGVISLVILSFIDNWNMVEQPLVFLKDQFKYPLSIFLARINASNLGLGFACGILAALPVFFLFLFLKEYLIRGIEYTNLK